MAGGLLNLIAALSGHNKVQGGPQQTIDPATGEKVFTYNPYDAKRGFLSHWGMGRSTADELNARIGGQAFLQQEEGRRLSSEAEKERTHKSTESRKDRRSRIREKRVEGLNAQQLAARNQALKILQDAGIPSDPQTANELAYDKALTPGQIGLARTKQDIERGVYTSPEGKRSAERSIIDKNLAQGAENIKNSTTVLSKDQIARIPKIYNQESTYFRGPQTGPESTETTGGFTIQTENGPQTIGGTTKVLRGGTRQPLTPEEEEEASKLQYPGDTEDTSEEVQTSPSRTILPDPGISTAPYKGPKGTLPKLANKATTGVKNAATGAIKKTLAPVTNTVDAFSNAYKKLWSGEPLPKKPRPAPRTSSTQPTVRTVPPDYGPQIPNIPIQDEAPAPYLSPKLSAITNSVAPTNQVRATPPAMTNMPAIPQTNTPAQPQQQIPPQIMKELETIALLEKQLGTLNPNASAEETMRYAEMAKELDRRLSALEAITGMKMPR